MYHPATGAHTGTPLHLKLILKGANTILTS
jgi:hypothetical protein